MKFLIVIPLLSLSGFAAPLKPEPQSLSVNLDSAQTLVRERNPELNAAQHLIEIARARLAGSGLRDNPSLETSFETDRRFDDLMFTVGVSQTFPTTNRLSLEKKVSSTLVKAAIQEVRNVERLLVEKTQLKIIQILALREQKSLVESEIQIANTLSQSLQSAAKRGEGSQLDVSKAKIESSLLTQRSHQIDLQINSEIAALKNLLDVAPEGQIHLKGSLPQAKIPPLVVATLRRPDLLAAQLHTRSASEQVALEKSRKYDDVEAGIFVGIGREEDQPTGLESEQIIGFSLSIPLPLNNDNSAAVEEAHQTQQHLEKTSLSLSRRISREARQYYAEMQQWQAINKQLETELLPAAESHLTLARQAYQQGHSDLPTVILARQKTLSLTNSRLETLREFHLARISYLSATAQP